MVSGVTLIVQAVGLLWLGIATNAIKIVLPEIAPAADNGTTHSSAASEQQPCWDGATACMANEKCLSCVEALDTDDDGEEEEEEMSGDDDGLGELSCDTVDTLACEYFGADESCVANDEYEEYIGEHWEPIAVAVPYFLLKAPS